MNKQHASISSDPPSIAEQKWEGLADETRIAPVDYTLINYQYLKWHVKKLALRPELISRARLLHLRDRTAGRESGQLS